MPVDVRLSDDATHLIYDIADPLDINDLMAAYKEEKRLRDETPHTLHSVIDMTNVRRIPPNWLTAKAGPGLTHERSGQMLFVGLSRGLMVIVRTILSIARYNKMKLFNDRQEAETYLATITDNTTQNDSTAPST